MIQRKVPAELEEIKKNQQLADSLRAIDGARTRGLDLGKVARYQLRHYRIGLLNNKIYITTGVGICQMFFGICSKKFGNLKFW